MQNSRPISVLTALALGGATMALAGSPAAGAAAPATDAAKPVVTYAQTLGHTAMPAMTPGGIALGPDRSVYVANTGNDTVAKYLPGQTTPVWEKGTRGAPRAQGSFNDPRDVTWMAGRVYVAEPGGVQVLDADTGQYLRNLKYPFKVPIGVTTGFFADGSVALVVSDGRTGAAELFDEGEVHRKTFPELAAGSGTRDADTDAAGNVYVADYRNNRINKFSPKGDLLRQWDGGTNCKIPKPYGVEVDDAGRVYIAASNNNLIRVFNADGQCLKTYGTSGHGITKLSQLRRVAVGPGPTPEVYAADLWGLKVIVYNVDGTINRTIGDGAYPAPGGINETTSVAVDGRAVYATDVNNHRITVWRHDTGAVSTFGVKGKQTKKAAFNWPMGVGLDPRNGKVWVGDTHSYNIKEFPAYGSVNALRQFSGVGAARLNWPGNVAVDNAGNIYVVELSGKRVSAYTPSLSRKWVADNLPGAQGIVWDKKRGRVLVTTAMSKPIVALNPGTGARTSLGVTTGGAVNQLGPRPGGIAVDAAGRIWVGDTNKNRIVMLTPAGGYAGVTFGSGGTGDANFRKPMGVAFGPDGKLYVADSWNGRIQVLNVT